MGDHISPYERFRRALEIGDGLRVRAAAHELTQVSLQDALAICVVLRNSEPERFERAAIRWIVRMATERREATLADVRAAADAFSAMGTSDDEALATLGSLTGT
jgi:hypothetical protein